MNFLKNCLKGLCIGAGAILPGISSGVLCVIFGIYDKLVESILNIFHDFKKNFFFLLPIFIGSAIGIVILGNILTTLFTSYPMQTKYSFIGLILGSIPLLIKKVHTNNIFYIHNFIYTIIAFSIGLLCVILENYISNNIITSSAHIITILSTNSTLPLLAIILLIIAGFFMSIGIVVPRN